MVEPPRLPLDAVWRRGGGGGQRDVDVSDVQLEDLALEAGSAALQRAAAREEDLDTS